MRRLLALLAVLLPLAASPAFAQTDADTDAAIGSNLGAPEYYREAFDAIQQAVADNDKAALAAWVQYPITIRVGGEIEIEDEAAFEAAYDTFMTDEIRDAITSQKWSELFVNYQGMMFGNGQLWVNGICKNDTCDDFDVRIITIQSTKM